MIIKTVKRNVTDKNMKDALANINATANMIIKIARRNVTVTIMKVAKRKQKVAQVNINMEVATINTMLKKQNNFDRKHFSTIMVKEGGHSSAFFVYTFKK